MSKVTIGIILTLLLLGMLPFALIARSRASQSDSLPPHLVLDMDKQPRGKAQRFTPLFADHRFMRPEIEGTIAREDLTLAAEQFNDAQNPGMIQNLDGKSEMQIPDSSAEAAILWGRVRPAGMSDDDFAKIKPHNESDEAIAKDTFFIAKIPAQITITTEFIHRGQERFNIYCSPCHGESGYGDGMVAQRVKALRTDPLNSGAIGAWADPQNLQDPKIAARPDGHIFNTITNGIRNMPSYDKQISVADRWAIVSYVRALQLSQNAPEK